MKIQRINKPTPGSNHMHAWRITLPNGKSLTAIGLGLTDREAVEAYIREKFTRLFKGES